MKRDDLRETYSRLEIRELLEILDHKEDYTPLAIEVVKEEIAARNITEVDIQQHEEYRTEQAISFIRKNITYDLSLLQKNLFFFIWLPLLTSPFRQNFKDDGYILKLIQANYYSITGFVFFMLISIIGVSLNFTDITFLGTWILSFPAAYFFDELFNRKRLIERLRKQIADASQPDGHEKDKS